MTRIFYIFLLFSSITFAQIDTQQRFTSDSRQFFTWSDDTNSYILKETEYEHSVIDVREIGSQSNGYIAISLNDNGITRLYHGSINAYSVNENKEATWQMRSKMMRGKLTLNEKEQTLTYVYDANEKRYNKIFIFKLKPELENVK